MSITYIVDGIRVDPNGKPVDEAPEPVEGETSAGTGGSTAESGDTGNPEDEHNPLLPEELVQMGHEINAKDAVLMNLVSMGIETREAVEALSDESLLAADMTKAAIKRLRGVEA